MYVSILCSIQHTLSIDWINRFQIVGMFLLTGHVETVCLLTHSWRKRAEKAWFTGASVTGSRACSVWWEPSFYVWGNWSRSSGVATIILFQKTSQRFYYFGQSEKTSLLLGVGRDYEFIDEEKESGGSGVMRSMPCWMASRISAEIYWRISSEAGQWYKLICNDRCQGAA